MSTYNTDLQTNNTSLEEILETINNLPEESDGVDTSDATATASDILSGKTAYVKGTKITGNIASQAAKTIIPTATPQVAVLSGRYTAGAITVQGDSNLKAENIAEGVSIFGVTGTHSGGASGGGSTDSEDSLITREVTTYTNDRVATIGSYAFYFCSKLTNVSFPNCTSIGRSAFCSCSKLTNVSFPNCTSIGRSAFYNCSKLTNVSFPNCTSIGEDAFYGCSLTSVSFPNCTSIGRYAFQKCSSLRTIYLGASTICRLAASNAFSMTGIWSTKGYIYVPSSLYSSYKTATNWVFFSKRIFSYTF